MADIDQQYWEEAAADHRSVYVAFISKVKYAIAIAVVIVAVMLFLGS